jgi:hypothetical protein
MKLLIYVFICGLFSDAVSNSEYIALNDLLLNNELERMWKEAVVAYCTIPEFA